MKPGQLFLPAIAISMISALYVLLGDLFKINAIWLPFISWSLYFITGAKPSLLPKLIFGLLGGMMIGAMTVIISTYLAGFAGILALPLTVFIMVFIISFMELVKEADMIPAYFFSYSSYFAYYYGKFGGEEASAFGILPEFSLLIILGLGLGLVSSRLREKLFQIKRG